MKTYIINLFLLPALIAALGLIPAIPVAAQTFTTVHTFTANPSGTNSDGVYPLGGLITNSSGNTLYGTATYGGISGAGAVFAVNTDGTGFTNLHSFAATYGPFIPNSDGADPQAGLTLLGNTLYGTTFYGGSSGAGTVFAVKTDGTGFTNLYSFTATDPNTGSNSDGAFPQSGLILSGNTLYGTAYAGGSSGKGTIFAVNTDGTGFTNLHSFATLDTITFTNSDGAEPHAGLVLSGNTLYGTTEIGGSSGGGTVFAVNTNGTGFTNLHSFTALSNGTNSDGGGPVAGLVLSGNTLYGTTVGGGSSGSGTAFAVNTDGTGFTNLHNFTATIGPVFVGPFTNSDGAWPYAGLILSGNTLYGTTFYGGSSGAGTVFAVKTDGTGFTNLYSFTATDPNTGGNSDGAFPQSGLMLSDNTLYGTVYAGGSSGKGTVFSLSFAPQLAIIPSGDNVILTWPNNVAGFDYSGFTLQSTTNLVSTAVWISPFPAPVDIDGLNTVIDPISGTQKFYRLSTHPGGCHINLDCPPGTKCVNGKCVYTGGGIGGGG